MIVEGWIRDLTRAIYMDVKGCGSLQWCCCLTGLPRAEPAAKIQQHNFLTLLSYCESRQESRRATDIRDIDQNEKSELLSTSW